MDIFNLRTGWTSLIIWFLHLLVSECVPLPDSDPLMYGEVHSPQYPQPYPPNLQKQWDLSVPEGFRISLTFTHLDIEASADCYYDSITVLYDEKLLGKFCGNENSADGHHPGYQPILSPGSRLTLLFQSDDYNPDRHQNVGFSAQYQAIDIDECSAPEPEDGSGPLCSQICLNTLGSYLCTCHHGYELRSDQRSCMLSCGGGVFDELEGHLLSPGYPNPSPHALSCQYIISVESGFSVSLNFSDKFHIESVDTEEGLQCPYHWLEVNIPDRNPMRLCGETSPGLINTNSNTVRLDYRIDDQGQSHGWSLDYSTHRVKCPVPDKVVNGRVTPSLTEYFYRDHIYVRCDEGYKLMKDGQEIKGFSAMCQSNGQWHLPLPECHIIDCGEPEPLLNGGVTFLSGVQNQYLSVVQYHCNEPFYSSYGGNNVTFTCEADRQWRANHQVILRPVCLPVCGRPTKQIENNFKRIVGGNDAPQDTIPWQALVSVYSSRGGGMIIADHWILTAAHVVVANGQVQPPEAIRIYLGHTDAHKIIEAGALTPIAIHVHHGYNKSDTYNNDNDIALIKLQDPVTFSASIMPLCLPEEGDTYETGMMGLVSGFGITDQGTKRLLTNKLKYVQVPLVLQERCSSSLKAVTGTRTPILTDNMFCAGTPEGGQDSCNGDSGSAFTLQSEDGRFWAAGIVSWGVRCGQRGTYGFYTKVANYVKWMNRIMQEN
ncbi:complement C1r subcomponent-like [Girardinichthys multiradiatus]|uniref:complement C1r subcomponent-like n=1 Tax=Girardinichthys multiradiatus TaxID=208333 RepID=UPI001FAE44F9|nr:complement C1r subcomponent-like [Girardinichthys multiradiatus]